VTDEAEQIIDVEKGAALIGDVVVYCDIVTDYLRVTGQMLAEIDTALAADDLVTLVLKAHSVKGASGSLAMPRMNAAGAALEKAARMADRTLLPGLVQQLHEEFAVLKDYLHHTPCVMGCSSK